MMKRFSLEEILIFVFLLTLIIFGIVLYNFPTQFFTIYDRILLFMLQ